MRHRRWSWWVHLICLLPLAAALVLVLSGVPFDPLLVPVVMLLCCLAMAALAAEACHDPRHPNHRPVAGDPAPTSPTVPGGLDDVFRVDSADRVGAAVVLRGELLVSPDEAFGRLEARLAGTGYSGPRKLDHE